MKNEEDRFRLVTVGYGYVTDREKIQIITPEEKLLHAIWGEKASYIDSDRKHSELVIELPDNTEETISFYCDCIFISAITSYKKQDYSDMSNRIEADLPIHSVYGITLETVFDFVQEVKCMSDFSNGESELSNVCVAFKSIVLDFAEKPKFDFNEISTICFELKYCKDESTEKERRNPFFLYWGGDSLFCNSNEETLFYERYFAPIKQQYKDEELSNFFHMKMYNERFEMKMYKERFESQKIFYYTREQTSSIIESIKKDQPENSQVVIGWLEKATTEYNGFYLIGV